MLADLTWIAVSMEAQAIVSSFAMADEFSRTGHLNDGALPRRFVPRLVAPAPGPHATGAAVGEDPFGPCETWAQQAAKQWICPHRPS